MENKFSKLPDGHLSFSRIKTFSFCPRMYRLSYIDKLKGIKPVRVLLGSFWHLGAEYGLKKMIDKITPKPREVSEVAVEGLNLELKKETVLEFDEFDSSHKTAKDDLKKMSEIGFKAMLNTFHPTESEISFEFETGSGLKIKGRIDEKDRNIDGAGLTEMKTTTRIPSYTEMFDYQTSIYQLAGKFDWLRKFFVIRYKNINRDIKVMDFIKPADKGSNLFTVIEDIESTAKLITSCQTNGFPKTNNLQTCGWCSFRFQCRPEIFTDLKMKERILFDSKNNIEGYNNGAKREKTIDVCNRGHSKGQGLFGDKRRGSIARSKSRKLPSGF